MRLLATADLHFCTFDSDRMKEFRSIVKKEAPDCIAIAGDVYDARSFNPFDELDTLNVPVVFCLGNHEFAYRSVHSTLSAYRLFSETAENVYCLDTKRSVEIGGVTFVGNVLWYDGSLSSRPDVDLKLEHIDGSWLDCSIDNFDPVEQNRKCVEAISGELFTLTTEKSVLVTHCVPYWKLNQWQFESPDGVYNIYSGMHDLFDKLPTLPDIAICGHTHRRARVEYVKDDQYVQCYNIGNEYQGNIEYEIIEV